MAVIARECIVVWTCNRCGQAIDGTLCITCGDQGASEVGYVRADLHRGAVDTLGKHLATALAYAWAHPHVPKKWRDEAANDLATYRGQ